MPTDYPDWARPIVAGLSLLDSQAGIAVSMRVTVTQPQRSLIIVTPGEDTSLQDCQLYVTGVTSGIVVFSGFVSRGQVVPVFVDPSIDAEWDVIGSTGFSGSTPWYVFADTSPAIVEVARVGQQAMGNSVPVALASDQGVIGVQDSILTLPGYTVAPGSVSTAVVNSVLLQLAASPTESVNVVRVRATQEALAGAAGVATLALRRYVNKGSGGAAVTPAKLSSTDPASDATAETLCAVAPTGVTTITTLPMPLVAAVTGTAMPTQEWTFGPAAGLPPLRLRAGTNEAIVLFLIAAVAGATVRVSMDYTQGSV